MVTYKEQAKIIKKHEKKEKYHETRCISKELKTPATVWIYSDKVAIVIYKEDPKIILIKSEAVYESFKNYFELLWKTAKK